MERGDHLFVYSLGYSHHGIATGDGRVIHFDSDPWRKLAGQALMGRATRVSEVILEEFAQGRPIYVRDYDRSDDPDLVVARARMRMGESCYHVFDNNCEHFAIWCKTGQHVSTQVEDFVDACRPMARGMAAATLLVRSSRFLPPPARPWLYGAAAVVSIGAFTHRYVEHRWRRFARRES